MRKHWLPCLNNLFGEGKDLRESSTLEQLTSVLGNLHVGYALERSTKFAHNRLIGNRYLLGVFKDLLTPASLEAILAINIAMGMPANFRGEIDDKIDQADWLLMAQEVDGDAKIQKFYLEYNKSVRNRLNDGRAVRLHDGYKWDIADPSKFGRATYDCFPAINCDTMMRRIENIYDSTTHRTEIEFAKRFISLASSRIPHDSMVYLEVAEEYNPRNSFDIAIHKAGLKVEDYADLFHDLAEHYSIQSDELSAVLQPILKEPMGHFSGGRDRYGRSFVTLYYGIKSVNP